MKVSGKAPNCLVDFGPSELKNTVLFSLERFLAKRFGKQSLSLFLSPRCCFVQKPSTGSNHSCFPEAILGTQGSFILMSLGTLDQVSDAFDAVMSNMTYPLKKHCSPPRNFSTSFVSQYVC